MIDHGAIYEVTVNGACDGQAVVNQLHFATQSPADPNQDHTMQHLLTGFIGLWRNSVLTRLSSAYKVVRYTVVEYSLWLQGAGAIERKFIVNQADERLGDVEDDLGLVAGAWLPTYVTVTGRKKVLRAGRRFHGSTRLSPIVEADTLAGAGNTLTDAAYVAFSGTFSNFAGPLLVNPGADQSTLRLQIFHKAWAYKTNPPNSTAREQADQVTATWCNRQVGSQLSRKRSNNLL